MILHGEVRLGSILRASAPFLMIVTLWNLAVIFGDEVLDLSLIGDPGAPVATLGVAVAFFLGFKNTSAFSRWWEARGIWGEIVNASRDWANAVGHLVDTPDAPPGSRAREVLIERHIAWLNALAFQLRSSTPLSRRRARWMFGFGSPGAAAESHRTPESWQRHLPGEDRIALDGVSNKAMVLLHRQGATLQELARSGALDPIRQVAMMDRLRELTAAQGKCERIKNTPFPRQVAELGTIFTWIFIFLLPLLFNDAFVMADRSDASVIAFVAHALLVGPTSILVCWVFYLTEKLGDSMEDPFDGEVTDVPISALCRTIEIDMRQVTGVGTVPEPLKPRDGVLL